MVRMLVDVTQVPEAMDVVAALTGRGLTIGAAEGDTGGVLLSALTVLPGSSAVVLGGVVAYGDGLKRDVLGVAAATLAQHGAVSAETAQAMARGVQRLSGADVGVAITGIAGPGGARPGKPVGVVFVAGVLGSRAVVRRHVWTGDRAANRAQSASAACRLVLELVAGGGE
ncbi:MAG: hypothetical protein NVSMB2_17600 [Chloroflexota bacterium]